jgi:hypothetical protein
MEPVRCINDEPLRLRFSLATAGFAIAVICVLLAEYQALGREAVFAWWLTLLLVTAFVMHRRKEWFPRNIALGVSWPADVCGAA